MLLSFNPNILSLKSPGAHLILSFLLSNHKAMTFGAIALIFWSFAALVAVELKAIPPFQLAAFAMGGVSCFMLVYIAKTKQWELLKQPIHIWILGAVFFSGFELGYFTAFKLAPPIQVDLINYLWPIVLLLMLAVKNKETLSMKHMFSALISLIAIYLLLSNGKGIGAIQLSFFPGYLSAFMGAMSWAAYNLLMKSKRNVPSAMIGGFSLIGCIACLIAHALTEQTVMPTTYEFMLLMLMTFGMFGAAYLLWDYAVKFGCIKKLSVMSYLTPVMSVLILAIFNKTSLTLITYLSTALITLSVVLASLPSRKVVDESLSISDRFSA